MKSIKQRVITAIPGVAFGSIDFGQALANYVTAAVELNHRPGLHIHDLANQVDAWDKYVSVDHTELLKMVGVLTSEGKTDLASSQHAELVTAIGNMSRMLSDPPSYVGDIGEAIAEELLKTPFWAEESSLTLSTGFIRRTLTMSMPNVDERCLPRALFMAPTPFSGWSKAFARAMLLMDRGRIGSDLIPQLPETIAGQKPNEKIIGQRAAFTKVVAMMASFMALENWQGTVYWARCLSALHDWLYNTLKSLRPHYAKEGDNNVLEVWYRSVIEVRSLPLQSVAATAVAPYAKEGMLDSVYGDLPLYFSPWELNDKTASSLISAFERYLEDEQVGRAVQERVWGRWFESSLDCQKPKPKTDDSSVPEVTGLNRMMMIDFPLLVRALKEWPYAEYWTDIAAKLGWKALPADLPVVLQRGARFMLTDGISYSGHPVAAIAGLNPVLAMSRLKLYEADPLYESNFGTKMPKANSANGIVSSGAINAAFDRSVIVGKGYTAATLLGDRFSARIIPWSETMGEDGLVPWSGQSGVPGGNGEAVRAFYFNKAKGVTGYAVPYPSIDYDRMPAEISIRVTDWDVWAVNSEKASITSAWSSYWGTQLVTEPAKVVFAQRSGGFKRRMVVKTTMANRFVMVSPIGTYVATLEQKGYIEFGSDDELTLSHDSSYVDQIADLISAGSWSGETSSALVKKVASEAELDSAS